MTFRPWQAATHCTDGPQPGTMALMQAALDVLGDEGLYSLGIYNCRSVRGASTTSTHGEGRAGDFGFAIGDPDGDRLCRVFVDKAWALGLQCVIYEREIWSRNHPDGDYYSGVAPHYDHIHAEQTRYAAEHLTLAHARRVLRNALEETAPKPDRVRLIDYSNVRQKFVNAAYSGQPTTKPNVGVKWTAIAFNRVFKDKPERARTDGIVDDVVLRMNKRWEANRVEGIERPNVIPQLGGLRALGEESGLFEVRV